MNWFKLVGCAASKMWRKSEQELSRVENLVLQNKRYQTFSVTSCLYYQTLPVLKYSSRPHPASHNRAQYLHALIAFSSWCNCHESLDIAYSPWCIWSSPLSILHFCSSEIQAQNLPWPVCRIPHCQPSPTGITAGRFHYHPSLGGSQLAFDVSPSMPSSHYPSSNRHNLRHGP